MLTKIMFCSCNIKELRHDRRGFAASQARLLMLTARKSDLELQIAFITQARVQLANALAQVGDNAAQAAAITEQDKLLAEQQQRLEVQLQAVTAEIETVQKIIQQNCEASFKIDGC
jgi:seryl-tRNA synthetase